MTARSASRLRPARAARRAVTALLALLAALAPSACCGRYERADAAPSLAFAAGTFTNRVAEDADATVRRVEGLPKSLETEFGETPERLGSACRLYFGD